MSTICGRRLTSMLLSLASRIISENRLCRYLGLCYAVYVFLRVILIYYSYYVNDTESNCDFVFNATGDLCSIRIELYEAFSLSWINSRTGSNPQTGRCIMLSSVFSDYPN